MVIDVITGALSEVVSIAIELLAEAPYPSLTVTVILPAALCTEGAVTVAVAP
jgi:hypothetical protein